MEKTYSWDPESKWGSIVEFNVTTCRASYGKADSIDELHSMEADFGKPLSLDKIAKYGKMTIHPNPFAWIGMELLRHHVNKLQMPTLVVPDFAADLDQVAVPGTIKCAHCGKDCECWRYAAGLFAHCEDCGDMIVNFPQSFPIRDDFAAGSNQTSVEAD